jgi:hypothetical protein
LCEPRRGVSGQDKSRSRQCTSTNWLRSAWRWSSPFSASVGGRSEHIARNPDRTSGFLSFWGNSPPQVARLVGPPWRSATLGPALREWSCLVAFGQTKPDRRSCRLYPAGNP